MTRLLVAVAIPGDPLAGEPTGIVADPCADRMDHRVRAGFAGFGDADQLRDQRPDRHRLAVDVEAGQRLERRAAAEPGEIFGDRANVAASTASRSATRTSVTGGGSAFVGTPRHARPMASSSRTDLPPA